MYPEPNGCNALNLFCIGSMEGDTPTFISDITSAFQELFYRRPRRATLQFVLCITLLTKALEWYVYINYISFLIPQSLNCQSIWPW